MGSSIGRHSPLTISTWTWRLLKQYAEEYQQQSMIFFQEGSTKLYIQSEKPLPHGQLAYQLLEWLSVQDPGDDVIHLGSGYIALCKDRCGQQLDDIGLDHYLLAEEQLRRLAALSVTVVTEADGQMYCEQMVIIKEVNLVHQDLSGAELSPKSSWIRLHRTFIDGLRERQELMPD